MLSPQFLNQMAYAYQLSTDQEKVFLLRFAQDKDYEEIARELNTSAGACLKRMGQVYKKFGIPGGTRGKESQLRHFLLQEYQSASSPSRGGEQKVVIIYSSIEPDLSLARQLHSAITAASYQVFMAEDSRREQKNYHSRLQAELSQCDRAILLLSPQSAFSDLLIEEVKLASDLPSASVAIRLNFPPSSPLNYDLGIYLQEVPQLEWRSPADTKPIVAKILSLFLQDNIPDRGKPSLPPTWETLDGQPLPVASPELPEGQVDLASTFYVERPPIESRCQEMILQPGALIRIKAPRQMGKTSLMARILHHAGYSGYRTVHLSFQLADKEVLNNLSQFLKWFCANVGYSLQLPNQIDDYWDDFLGSKVNCKAYFEQYLLKEIGSPLALGLDEVDLVFPYSEIAEDFFGLLRAWHEEGKRRAIWKQFRLVVVHSTEVYLPMDINQSPFNVGLPIDLPEFTSSQAQDLARRYGLNWNEQQVESLMNLVGGHPYLLRVAFYYIARQDIALEELLETGATEAGLYSDHLRRHLWNLEKHPELTTAMKEVVSRENPVRLASEQAFKLDSMGLVKFQGNRIIPRCNLYRLYFGDLLNE